MKQQPRFGNHRRGYERFEPWNGLYSWWVVVCRGAWVTSPVNTQEIRRNARRKRCKS